MVVKKKLICLGIMYTDKKFGVSGGRCSSLANSIADFYRKNSNGALVMSTRGAAVRVPYPAKPGNVNKSELFAMRKYPGYDYYVMVVSIINVSHAGRKVAHLINFLARDGQHEVGHLLGLGHAGSYDKHMKLDAYGDSLSVMGRFPSAFLTAPQYDFKNWIPDNQIEIYKKEQGLKIFTVRRLVNFDNPVTAMVKIPTNGRAAYISFPQGTKFYGSKPYLALHMGANGASQKVATFMKDYTDKRFNQIYIKIISSGPSQITFSIEPIVNPESSESSESSLIEDDPTEPLKETDNLYTIEEYPESDNENHPDYIEPDETADLHEIPEPSNTISSVAKIFKSMSLNL